jgi:hypothetical protein
MQNILYHTVIAKKKGPHTLGTRARVLLNLGKAYSL